ncbi:MAG: AIR synthase related protein [Thermotaleaceae bacterium]
MENNHRDVGLIPLDSGKFLVLACDSCGAIGHKEQDQVAESPIIAGKYTARVVLMEVAAIGAKPTAMTVNICNEPDPTGKEILEGIREELAEWGLDIPLVISTEKNMATTMTALGLTAVGLCSQEEIILNRLTPGNFLYCIGSPKLGKEVTRDYVEIANAEVLRDILQREDIQEIIPLGSSGVRGEAMKLAAATGLQIKFAENIEIDIDKSAGPSTAILVITEKLLTEGFKIPCYFIGELL